MKKVVMTPNPYRDRDFSCVLEAQRILSAAGVEAKICLAFEVDKSFALPQGVPLFDLQEELRTADALICFGGDGTILHTSKAAARCGIPILGVNIGTVGFMAELESGEMGLLSRLATDDYQIDERMTLEKKLSDARYALDTVTSKLKASQTEADELRRQVAELKNDDF